MTNGIPKNPGTIKTNGIVIDNYVREFFAKYLPLYGYHVTDGYRTEAENKAIPGAAPDSAHMHNLARDFVILDRAGEMVPEDKAKTLHEQFFVDWVGYTEFSPSRPEGDPLGKKSYHIHANLPREWTKRTRWFGGALVFGAVVFTGFKVWNSKKFQDFLTSFKKE